MITTRRPVALGQRLQPLLQPRAGRLRAGDVGADPGALGAPAARAQPLRHRRRASRRRPGSRESAARRGRSPAGTPAPRYTSSAAAPPTPGRSGPRARSAAAEVATAAWVPGRVTWLHAVVPRLTACHGDCLRWNRRECVAAVTGDAAAATAVCKHRAPMRAATIRDGEIAVEEHPDPEPAGGRAARPRARGRPQRRRHAAAQGRATRRRPARRRTSRGSSWPARSSPRAAASSASSRATA